MISLQEFLNHVLPTDGAKCWVAIRKTGGKPEIQQGFVYTTDELVGALKGIDQRHWDAYMGCATFDQAKLADVAKRHEAGERLPNGKPLKMRSHENALVARSFWLDLDAGEKKPYANAEAAIEALDAFCAVTGLPLPSLVESGNGVHAWWVMDQDIPAATWERAAAALKELCRTHGLHADPARTSDISSILRGPETHNWKSQPKPVVCDELMPPVSAQAFLLQLMQQAPVHAPATPPVMTSSLGATLANVPKPPSEPSYGAVAVQHCKQLAHFRDTHGNIEEPLWYANLGVLAHCADGVQLAHAWSSGHPQYSESETTAKLEQALTNAGPTTCGKFTDLNPAGCAGCPHRVTSPIVLGRGQTVTAPTPVEQLGDARPVLPFGYKWGRAMELIAVVPGEKAEDPPEHIIISQYAIYLSSLRTSENKTDGRGLVFQQWMPHEGWVQFEVSAGVFAGTGGQQALAEHGVLIHPNQWPRFKTYAHRAALMLRGAGNDDVRYDQFGWKMNYKAFILGQIVFNSDGSKKLAAGSKEVEQRARMMVPPSQGNLAAWSEVADRLFQVGCEGQAFALLCSFAAPLMSFVSGEEGGAIVSLYSAGSGTGKSTALDAAASVWGQLDALRLITMDTQVAKFRSISTLCNLPIIFEEMFSKDPMIVQEFVRNFTTGRDKKRGQRNGSVDTIENKWQTIMLSASNQSLLDNLAFGGADPQAARVFELEMSLPKSMKAAASKELRDALMNNRGYAGIAFIEAIVKPGVIEWITASLPQIMAKYEEMLKTNTEHRFFIRLLACVAVAAHIVERAGILHFDVQRILTWATDRAAERIRDRPSFDALMAFKSVVNEHSQDCLVVADKFNARSPTVIKKQPQRALHMRAELRPQRLYIAADTVRKWLTEAHKPFGAVLREMKAEGVLLNEKCLRNLGAGTEYATLQVPCWEIDMGHPAMSGEMRLVETEAAAASHEQK